MRHDFIFCFSLILECTSPCFIYCTRISRDQKLLTWCPVTLLLKSFRCSITINTFIFTTASEVRRILQIQPAQKPAVSDATQFGCLIWKTIGLWYFNGTFICFNPCFHRDQFYFCVSSSCAELGPQKKELLITMKYLVDVVGAIFSQGFYAKDSGPHRWCLFYHEIIFFFLQPHASHRTSTQRRKGKKQKIPMENVPLHNIKCKSFFEYFIRKKKELLYSGSLEDSRVWKHQFIWIFSPSLFLSSPGIPFTHHMLLGARKLQAKDLTITKLTNIPGILYI